MGLYFHNKTNESIDLVFAHKYEDCEGTQYKKKGWYTIAPGQKIKVWSGWAGSYKFYYYAENISRTRVWPREGRDYFTEIPNNAFDMCWDLASTTFGHGPEPKELGMGLIDPDWGVMDHTISLK
jgi:hypothetical protein